MIMRVLSGDRKVISGVIAGDRNERNGPFGKSVTTIPPQLKYEKIGQAPSPPPVGEWNVFDFPMVGSNGFSLIR